MKRTQNLKKKRQEKKSTKTYDELPETITPYDYADWRGVGESTARNIFNMKDFILSLSCCIK